MSQMRQYKKQPFYGLSTSVNENVSKLVKFINNTPNGNVTFMNLIHSQLFRTIDAAYNFVTIHKDNFTINRGSSPSPNDTIWVKTSLKLCDIHCRKNRVCNGHCGCLHFCRNFLLRGSTFCPFSASRGKGTCMFGHNLYDEHNWRLLEAHNLGSLSVEEIQILFRRRTCRSVSTMPQICLYYNNETGKKCSNKNCKSLHFCLDFINDRCIGKCDKSHTMSTKQNNKVLALFAIDKTWNERSLIQDLQKVMEHRRSLDSQSHCSSSHYDSDDTSVVSEVSDDLENGACAFPDKPPTYRELGNSMTSHEGPDYTCCRKCEENEEHIQHLLQEDKSNKELINLLMAKVSHLEDDISNIKANETSHDKLVNPCFIEKQALTSRSDHLGFE